MHIKLSIEILEQTELLLCGYNDLFFFFFNLLFS